MKKIEVEMLDNTINSAVLRLPQRTFPGVLIQGDSLSVLYNSARELEQLCQENKLDEAAELAGELREQLGKHLRIYETALDAHGISYPYSHQP